VDQLEQQLSAQADSLQDASRRLSDECRTLLVRDGHVQLKMSPEIIHSLEQSLGRTAKGYYKWFLLPSRRFFQAAGRLIEKGRDLAPLPGHEIRKKKAELEAKWSQGASDSIPRGKVTPEDVQRMLSLWSGATGDYRSPEYWEKEAEAILRRFVDEDKTNLSDAEWDALTSSLWEQLPNRARRRLATSALLMFGGLLLAFVDGGVSLISLQAMDLLGGLGVAASLGVNLKGAKDFERVLEEKLGQQQVANFHAIVCDLVGVPRCSSSMSSPPPSVPIKLHFPNYGTRERGWRQHRLEAPSLKEIRSYGR
jgi:hypothetical protein